MKQVLLIEDDPIISRTLQMSLPFRGYSLTIESTLQEGRSRFEQSEYDMVLLDLQLPDGTGFEMCKHIRSKNKHIPILMITAVTDESSAVEGFNSGADDYIRKPFGLDELTARMNKLLDRKVSQKEIINYRSIFINLLTRKVWIDKNEVSLAKREFEILALLVQKSGEVVTREDIISSISGSDMFDRTIDSHLSHLRKKLKTAGLEDIQIVPVYGIGYRLELSK